MSNKKQDQKNQKQEQIQQGQFSEQQQQNQQSSSQFIKTTKCGRRNLCDTCTQALSKYSCPGCQKRSCSLACINKHKQLNQCDGKAKKTQYVQKNSISQNTVRKDYQFIKGMLQSSDKVKKTLTGVTAGNGVQPKRFYFLRKHAKTQHNIKIHQAPALMQRHRQNISFYYMKTSQIYWVLQILYYKPPRSFTKKILIPQGDSKKLDDILPRDFICPQLLTKGINTSHIQQFAIYIQNKQIVQQKQKNNNQDQKQLKQKKNINPTKIIQLDPSNTLAFSLKNLNIYQFPSLMLVHTSFRKNFSKWKML